jgi:hypothetical protein
LEAGAIHSQESLALAGVWPGVCFGRDLVQPNRAIGLLWAGAAVLAIGLVSAGLGLIAGTPS